jgi:hypothetical protein
MSIEDKMNYSFIFFFQNFHIFFINKLPAERMGAPNPLRRVGPSSDDSAAARLAERHPASRLTHHVLGHVRACTRGRVGGRRGPATPPRGGAPPAGGTPRSPPRSSTPAGRARPWRSARAPAVDNPSDPALHAACR